MRACCSATWDPARAAAPQSANPGDGMTRTTSPPGSRDVPSGAQPGKSESANRPRRYRQHQPWRGEAGSRRPVVRPALAGEGGRGRPRRQRLHQPWAAKPSAPRRSPGRRRTPGEPPTRPPPRRPIGSTGPGRRAAGGIRRFIEDYRRLRMAEGFASSDPRYVESLPFRDTTGRNPGDLADPGPALCLDSRVPEAVAAGGAGARSGSGQRVAGAAAGRLPPGDRAGPGR